MLVKIDLGKMKTNISGYICERSSLVALLVMIGLVINSVIGLEAQVVVVNRQIKEQSLLSILTGDNWRSDEKIEMKSAVADGNEVRVRFNKTILNILVTQEKLERAADSIRAWTSKPNAKVQIIGDQINLSTLVPKTYNMSKSGVKPVVKSVGKKEGALTGRTFAVWNSHGRYYEKSLDRWEWQRARLFTTVEDLLSTSFVVPYLVPMLENAGASVYLPRERDFNKESLIADNDEASGLERQGLKPVETTKGYRVSDALRNFDNPFEMGTAETYSLAEGDTLTFRIQDKKICDMTAHLYVAYHADAANSDSVVYTVYDGRGVTRYVVDQRRGGSMWMPLGKHFVTSGGYDGRGVRVVVTGQGRVSVDAIRIGGGMGIVERNGKKSGVNAWAEGARYYLQSDGWSKTVYALSDGVNDYTDDINGRGEWVNALIKEKGIPVDASIAFHTDAGIAEGDSTIGTLTIVSTKNGKDKYTDGKSKSVARALAQKIETQIVNDIRLTWNKNWSERGIWDKGYSEARRADVPSVLIELLSHQNIKDIRYALHPAFRHDVSRSIYKSIVRFYEGDDAVIAPLPVRKIGMEQVGQDSIRLSWSPTIDIVEPSSLPCQYEIYVSHQGQAEKKYSTCDTTIVVGQSTDGIVSEYRIVALNDGGYSLASSPVCARLDGKKVGTLLVDGFDRISAPGVVDEPTWRGVIDNLDPSVPDGEDLFRTGCQYDFDPRSEWLDDDAPGCGASYSDDEMKVIRKPQYALSGSYITQSKEYFENSSSESLPDSVKIYLGDERTTWYGDMTPRHAIWSPSFIGCIEKIASICKDVYISGAYVGTDISDKVTAERIARNLGFKWRTNHASKVASDDFGNPVAHPDAIEPSKGAYTTERYTDSGMSAKIRYKNITISGH